MVSSNPESPLNRLLLPRALLVGGSAGVVCLSAASLLIRGGSAWLGVVTAFVGTGVIAFGIGLWAAAPTAGAASLRDRWAYAGLSVALAGSFATAWRLYGGFGGGAVTRVIALLVLVALPLYTLGLLLPPLLAWGERWSEAESEEKTGWGALGSLVTGLVVGSGLGAAAAGFLLIPWLDQGPLLLAVSVLLLVPLFFGEPEPEFDDERVLFATVTPFAPIRVTEATHRGEGQPERRLYVADEEESAELVRSGAPALAYVAAAEAWIRDTTPRGSEYLFLGGGAYTLPRRVAEWDPSARITVVERDPEVTRMAERFFGLRPDHGIRAVHGDARAFLERSGGAYRRLYLDVYAGGESLPANLLTREAFAAMASRLESDGALGVNLIGAVTGPEAVQLWSVVRTCQTVFPSVELYLHLGADFPDRQNLLLVGAFEQKDEPPARAGRFERWPRSRWVVSSGAAVLEDLPEDLQGPGRDGGVNRNAAASPGR